jgi:hypothetical protein
MIKIQRYRPIINAHENVSHFLGIDPLLTRLFDGSMHETATVSACDSPPPGLPIQHRLG